MAVMDDGELYIEIEGATEIQLRTGLLAARGVFEQAGIPICETFEAAFDLEGADLDDTVEELADDVFLKAGVLSDALAAAMRAAGHWPSSGQGALGLCEFRDVLPNHRLPGGPRYHLHGGGTAG